MSVRVEFKPEDCWIGIFWKRRTLSRACFTTGSYAQRTDTHVWVCLLPCFPIHLTFNGEWSNGKRK